MRLIGPIGFKIKSFKLNECHPVIVTIVTSIFFLHRAAWNKDNAWRLLFVYIFNFSQTWVELKYKDGRPFLCELLTKSACTIAHNIGPYDSSAHKSPEEPQQQLKSQQLRSLRAATSLESQSEQEEPTDGREKNQAETDKERSRERYIFLHVWCLSLLVGTFMVLWRSRVDASQYIHAHIVRTWWIQCVGRFEFINFPDTGSGSTCSALMWWSVTMRRCR